MPLHDKSLGTPSFKHVPPQQLYVVSEKGVSATEKGIRVA